LRSLGEDELAVLEKVRTREGIGNSHHHSLITSTTTYFAGIIAGTAIVRRGPAKEVQGNRGGGDRTRHGRRSDPGLGRGHPEKEEEEQVDAPNRTTAATIPPHHILVG
jgi:hypothetical protein